MESRPPQPGTLLAAETHACMAAAPEPTRCTSLLWGITLNHLLDELKGRRSHGQTCSFLLGWRGAPAWEGPLLPEPHTEPDVAESGDPKAQGKCSLTLLGYPEGAQTTWPFASPQPHGHGGHLHRATQRPAQLAQDSWGQTPVRAPAQAPGKWRMRHKSYWPQPLAYE